MPYLQEIKPDNTCFIFNLNGGNLDGLKKINKLKIVFEKLNYSPKIFISHNLDETRQFVLNEGNNCVAFIVVGGDGTLNYLINLVDDFENKIFGIIPAGSGNDFCKTLGTSSDLELIVDKIVKKTFESFIVDLWSIKIIDTDNRENYSKFINTSGIGFDAFVAKNKNDGSIKGFPGYLIALIKSLFFFSYFTPESTIQSINKQECLMMTLGNGKYSGGKFCLNPGAKLNDCLLNLTVIKRQKILNYLLNFYKVFSKKLLKVNFINDYISNNFHFSFKNPVVLHSDGEILSEKVKYVEYSIYPGKAVFMKF